jgi:hypothetical protein
MSLVRSTDKGVTWSRNSLKIWPSRERVAFDPDTGRNIRAEGGLPEVAVDRASGALYLVWQDASFSGVDEIAFSMSTDNGQTWSMPIRVNQPLRARVRRRQQRQPGESNRRVLDHGRLGGDRGVCFGRPRLSRRRIP